MRLLFLALVLANLAFFAYAQFAGESAARNPVSQLEVSAEKIKVLKASGRSAPDRIAPPAGSAPARTATAAPTACIEWGVFAGPDVARAEAALAKLELPAERIERTVTDAGGYWVYMPPQKTKADADRKVKELKALGVTEFFLVQDPGQWRNAISLGIFRTEEAAQGYLAKLKERGVRTAIAARRENFLKQVAFHVREPGAAAVARLALIQEEFPGSEIKAGTCPPPAVAAKG